MDNWRKFLFLVTAAILKGVLCFQTQFWKDYPSQIDLIWFSSFRGEDLNVIFYQNMPYLYNLYKSAERKISEWQTLDSFRSEKLTWTPNSGEAKTKPKQYPD